MDEHKKRGDVHEMNTAKMWEVTLTTTDNGEWQESFLFRPTGQDLIAAITGDITIGQQELKKCERADADELEYYQERLRHLREVAQNVMYGFANTQVRKRILVAGTLIGTVQVTYERVYTR